MNPLLMAITVPFFPLLPFFFFLFTENSMYHQTTGALQLGRDSASRMPRFMKDLASFHSSLPPYQPRCTQSHKSFRSSLKYKRERKREKKNSITGCTYREHSVGISYSRRVKSQFYWRVIYRSAPANICRYVLCKFSACCSYPSGFFFLLLLFFFTSVFTQLMLAVLLKNIGSTWAPVKL